MVGAFIFGIGMRLYCLPDRVIIPLISPPFALCRLNLPLLLRGYCPLTPLCLLSSSSSLLPLSFPISLTQSLHAAVRAV